MTASTPIAIAARELQGGPRGMSRWLREVLRAWPAGRGSGDVRLYVERGLPLDLDTGGFEVRPVDPGPGGGATAWEQWALPRALRADRPRALLGPANSVPVLSPVPTVVVVHDLSFEAHPEWFGLREGTRRRLLARASVGRSRAILADSAFTARELKLRYGAAPPRVRVVPCGVSGRFRPVADPVLLADVRRRFRADGDLVLAVGSVFNRRHLPELIAAFAATAATRGALRLLIVGDNRTHPKVDLRQLIREAGIEERAEWVETVDDETLIALYSIARVAVYLSDYEGFGLPPLEAIGCGAPVVASATSALAENLEGRAELVDEHTPQAIADALSRVLDRPLPPRERPPWLDGFSWTLAAASVRKALEDVA